MRYKQKIAKILAFTNWTQDRFADLIGVSNVSMNKWAKGRREPKGQSALLIDNIYEEIVSPYTCELESKADQAAEKLLKSQIDKLPDDNVCTLPS